MARDVWILVLHNQTHTPEEMATASKAAEKYRAHYKVPKERALSNNARDYEKFSKLTEAKWATGRIEDDDSGSLRKVKRQDKLLIIGHGNYTGIAGLEAEAVAMLLYKLGMRVAGVVSFKSCGIGQGDFLKDFREAMEAKKVDLGWIKGYTGRAEVTKSGILQTPKVMVHEKKLVHEADVGKMVEKTKVQVVEVKGNLWEDVKPPRTRKGDRLKVVEYTGKFKGLSFALSTSPARTPVPLDKPNFTSPDWKELDSESSSELVDRGDGMVDVEDDSD